MARFATLAGAVLAVSLLAGASAARAQEPSAVAGPADLGAACVAAARGEPIPGGGVAMRPRLKAFVDAYVMAGMLADPGELALLVDVAFDPSVLAVVMACAAEPGIWDVWLEELADREKLAESSARIVSGKTIAAWMSAPFNPAVHASFARLMSPARWMAWPAAVMNPTSYLPMLSWLSPAKNLERLAWPARPETASRVADVFAPGG